MGRGKQACIIFDRLERMNMKTEIIQFNYGDLCLPVEALEQCHHQGRCDDDVEYWEKQIDWDSQNMDAEAIRKEVSDWSEWDVSDDRENRLRILWLAAGNWQEDQFELENK